MPTLTTSTWIPVCTPSDLISVDPLSSPTLPLPLPPLFAFSFASLFVVGVWFPFVPLARVWRLSQWYWSRRHHQQQQQQTHTHRQWTYDTQTKRVNNKETIQQQRESEREISHYVSFDHSSPPPPRRRVVVQCSSRGVGGVCIQHIQRWIPSDTQHNTTHIQIQNNTASYMCVCVSVLTTLSCFMCGDAPRFVFVF